LAEKPIGPSQPLLASDKEKLPTTGIAPPRDKAQTLLLEDLPSPTAAGEEEEKSQKPMGVSQREGGGEKVEGKNERSLCFFPTY
jgi:hypothetical protein